MLNDCEPERCLVRTPWWLHVEFNCEVESWWQDEMHSTVLSMQYKGWEFHTTIVKYGWNGIHLCRKFDTGSCRWAMMPNMQFRDCCSAAFVLSLTVEIRRIRYLIGLCTLIIWSLTYHTADRVKRGCCAAAWTLQRLLCKRLVPYMPSKVLGHLTEGSVYTVDS